MTAYVYIMASKRNGTLYIGVTTDIRKRVYEHKHGTFGGFTGKYDCKILVWYEVHGEISNAIQREKNLKHWIRKWKLELIEKTNPDWNDLADQLGW